MSVTLFGMPQIKRGNEPITVQRRKDMALLVYLVVTSQSQSRDLLATLLWQDEGQTAARSNLRKSLSRLKGLLGENALLISQDQIQLHPDLTIHLDVKDFSARLEQFKQHHFDHGGQEQGLCPICRKALEEAADIYQADFLNGFSLPDSSTFEEWRFFQAESLRQNLAMILEQLAGQFASDGDTGTAIAYCRRWLALDRLYEPAQRQLILLYALSGQLAAARRQFEECVQLLAQELHAQPEPETLALFDAIQKKKVADLQRGVSTSPLGEVTGESNPSRVLKKGNIHHLPTYPSPFIGRQKELEEIIQLLQDPSCRLLTLLGPGGSGKTRLALQAASLLNESKAELPQDGVYFLSLAPLTDPDAIVSAMIDELKIGGQVRGVNPREKLLSDLHGRRLLLILDNFEHLLGESSISLISDLIAAAPQTRVIITSRERLNLQGEQIFRVEGLEIPAERHHIAKIDFEEDGSAFSALQLFTQCANRVQPGFSITQENYDPIVQICRSVQGMPLAIEMAAAWLEIFSPEEIRIEIDRGLDFLQTNLRDLPDRQRSLRAVFDSSWNLLDRQTRPVLKALSVFRAGFTREAAQAVAGASAKTLLDLTNKSWLQRLSSGRYQIHELLRQFCSEKLQQEAVTYAQVKKQYCSYYGGLASSLWNLMRGRDQKKAFASVSNELENLHTAWVWLVERRHIETIVESLLPALFYHAEVRAANLVLPLSVERTLEVIQSCEETPERERWELILRTAGSIPGKFSTYEDIAFGPQKAALLSAWPLLEKQGSAYQVDFWGIRLAYTYGSFIYEAAGIRYLEQSLSRLHQANRRWELATAHLCLAKLQLPQLSFSREKESAIEHSILDALHLFTNLGDELNVSYAQIQLGNLRLKQERFEEALEQWQLARATLMHMDEWSAASAVARLIGDAYIQQGQFKAGFDCFHQDAQIAFEHGHAQEAVGALSKESFEMVRYGDLTEALHIRQECVETIETIGPEYQIGWNYWEMGEVLRVLGHFEEAKEWYERSLKPFASFDDNVCKIFYFRGLGDIALAVGDYRGACQDYHQSMELAQMTRHHWAVAYALNGLARSELGLNNISSAEAHILSALQYAFKTGDRGILLVVLAGYTQLLSAEQKWEDAVKFGSLVESHYASWHETRDQVLRILADLKKSMTADTFSQAQKTGQTMDLRETAGSLISRQSHPGQDPNPEAL